MSIQGTILTELRKITDEEKQILAGSALDRSLYQTPVSSKAGSSEIEASVLLEKGKLITVRKHTRFLHFPPHTHNYVEVVYMCEGSTRHIINGKSVTLKKGELLFLNQHSVQEIMPAGENDIAVNFIILPAFFDYALRTQEPEENALRKFLTGCITGSAGTANYLHFKVADVLPVQNLAENLIWSVMNRLPNRRSVNQATMALLLLQLSNHIDSVETDGGDTGEKLILRVLGYIEEHYFEAELAKLADMLHYDISWISREIKKRTGKTFTELVQERRLEQASYLLRNTRLPVAEIARAVGYENISYFHRLFEKYHGCTPKRFRDA